jgi:hypothetical protein
VSGSRRGIVTDQVPSPHREAIGFVYPTGRDRLGNRSADRSTDRSAERRPRPPSCRGPMDVNPKRRIDPGAPAGEEAGSHIVQQGLLERAHIRGPVPFDRRVNTGFVPHLSRSRPRSDCLWNMHPSGLTGHDIRCYITRNSPLVAEPREHAILATGPRNVMLSDRLWRPRRDRVPLRTRLRTRHRSSTATP